MRIALPWILELTLRKYTEPLNRLILIMRMNLIIKYNKTSFIETTPFDKKYLFTFTLLVIILTGRFVYMNKKLKHQRENQIMNAALLVAVEKGYSNSRMDDIVKESKLSKGAIYWYYKSKKDVYLDLVDHWFKQYSSDVLIRLDTKKTASEKLNALFQYFSSQFVKNQSVFRVLSEFWSLSKIDPEFNGKLQKVYKVFLDYIIDIIKEGIKSNEFKNVDPRITALSILINVEGIHWFTLFEKSGVEAKEYISTISDFILSGLTTGLKNESS